MSQSFGQSLEKRGRALVAGVRDGINETVKLTPKATKEVATKLLQEQLAWGQAIWESLKKPLNRWTYVIIVCSVITVASFGLGNFLTWTNGHITERGYWIWTSISVTCALCAIALFFNSHKDHHDDYVAISSLWALAIAIGTFIGIGCTTTYTIQNTIIYFRECRPYFAGTLNVTATTSADWLFGTNTMLCTDANYWQFAATSYIVAFGIWLPSIVSLISIGIVIAYYLTPWNNANAIKKRAVDGYNAIMNNPSAPPAEVMDMINRNVVDTGAGSLDVSSVTTDNMEGIIDQVARAGGEGFLNDVYAKKDQIKNSYKFMKGYK